MTRSSVPIASLLALCVIASWPHRITAESPPPQLSFTKAESTLVPQTLLPLIHSAEVQSELEIDNPLPESVREILESVDRDWWRSRNAPEAERRKIIAEAEKHLVGLLLKELGGDKVRRLREIELQSQGARVLARADVASLIRLTDAQTAEVMALFQQTNKQKSDAKGTESLKNNESEKALKILTPDQHQRLSKLFGKNFDTSKLSRIYPLAPELIDSKTWVGSERTSLKELRGQVVLVHFYAFQCHNCVANFEHYKRWSETLKEKGVTVIGIQTPETEAERDPEKVRRAANRAGFQFPVLIDLDHSNWDAWANTMWPTVYVIDKQGYIRHWWQGELNWDGATGDKTIESIVERLLKE